MDPSPLDILTIRPCGDFFNIGRKAFVTRNTPNKLVSNVSRSASTVGAWEPIQRNPRIVHQDVEPPKATLHFSRCAVYIGLRSHVDLNELDGKALRAKLRNGLLAS